VSETKRMGLPPDENPVIGRHPIKEHWLDGVRCASEVKETDVGFSCTVRVMTTGAVIAQAFRSRFTTAKRPVTASAARSSGVKQARERIALERMRGRDIAVSEMEARS